MIPDEQDRTARQQRDQAISRAADRLTHLALGQFHLLPGQMREVVDKTAHQAGNPSRPAYFIVWNRAKGPVASPSAQSS